jgi:oxygen-independent coproporphyrinogen III oxidase
VSACESVRSTERWTARSYGLYIHVPFCLYKCYYCDFATSPHVPAQVDPFLECVSREAGRYESACPSLTSVYLGGGTPSVLSGSQMGRLLSAMRQSFDICSSAEVTVEANPETLTAAKLAAYRDAGVTRLSIGVQTDDDGVLAALGRDHSVADSLAAVALARAHGFATVSVDLIFGLPGQQQDHWARTLQAGLALGADHISLYGLTVEPSTVFEWMRRTQGLTVPSDDAQADMYAAAIDAVGEAGYDHYEISNFARPGHTSRHNLTYWADEPYIGLGPSACGHIDGRRYANVRGTKSYMQRVAEGRSVVVEDETLAGADARSQTVVLALRTLRGMGRDDYRSRYGRDLLDDFGADITPLQDAGLLAVTDGRLHLTRRGVMLANEVFVRLLP